MFKINLHRGVALVALITVFGGSAFAAKPANKSSTESIAETEVSVVTRIDPRYGNLDAFYGNLDAFWGNLDAFYGNLDAFYGNLDAFWGNLDAFYGNLDAFYGNLDAFYGNLDAFWGNLDAFRSGDLLIESEFDALLTNTEAIFGDAVLAETGMDFRTGFTTPLFSKYGIDAVTYDGIDNLTRDDLAMFLLEFHDQLMTFTGRDHIDHWMGTVNWSPRITQEAGGGVGVTVGILDTQIQDIDMMDTTMQHSWGYNVDDQHHGAAVASLIVGAHDGVGVMGIAPNARLSLDNPFDASFTAGWGDVRFGINSVGSDQASVINMSLGVRGWTLHQDWVGVFGDSMVQWWGQDAVFVKAAGNEGAVQTADIEWGELDAHNRLLIVGSVDPFGNISSFSNTPGDACLLVNGACNPENMLQNRFLVAPGELILVSDDAGGVTRASGTSFAAPIVTGAVALVQSRWQWLTQHPVETADVILRSAKDLGEPGVDGVFGWGLLDVEASQAPLDPNALFVNTTDGLVNLNDTGLTLEALGLIAGDETITAFEYIGETYRDFEVPIAQLNIEMTNPSLSVDSSTEEYLAASVSSSFEETTTTTKRGGRGGGKKKFAAFNDGLALHSIGLGATGSPWTAMVTATRRTRNDVVAADAVAFQIGAAMVNQDSGVTLRFGEGQGVLAFSGDTLFSRMSDHDIVRGGVNPFLGLASGGAYAGAALSIDEHLSLSFGITQDTDKHQSLDPFTGELRENFVGIDNYRATAFTADVAYALSDNVNLVASYTQLNETSGFLGGQGAGALSFEGGADTDAVTVGVNAYLPHGFALSGSMTGGKTREITFDNSILSIAEGGVYSTAFEVAASKYGVLGKTDRIRLSFAQPLHIENAGLAITTMEVVDRTTGELELVTNLIDGADRRYVSELLYATSINGGRASLGLFSQVELNRPSFTGAPTSVTGGARLDMKF